MTEQLLHRAGNLLQGRADLRLAEHHGQPFRGTRAHHGRNRRDFDREYRLVQKQQRAQRLSLR